MNTATLEEMNPLSTAADPRWAAVLARDASADGSFVYAVRTTGVYCRPSCAARTARPENVSFHRSPADARAAGFRPCKRCRPDEPFGPSFQARVVAQLCRWIDGADEPPTLAALARRAGMSPYHLHRVFKAVTGLTPKAYANARRARRVRDALAGADSVTDAIYEAGFNSSGRFYEQADGILGMTPTRYRNRGAGEHIRFAVGHSSLGAILVAATARGVCAILLGDDPDGLVRELQDRFPRATLAAGDADFDRWVATVVGFVEAPRVGLELPLDVRGTAFQERVWQALRAIPPGQTLSYTQLAQRMGAPKAVRAVAAACAANPLAVAVPCHRVVRNDGALSGYRWGVERKRALLERERQPNRAERQSDRDGNCMPDG
jgi:AraC family transcriptional regulator of adaptative response/methylated-DNA-[protein]-cysteine methyltransferase